MMSYGDFGHESRHSRPGTIIKLSSYGGFLKYGYPKSSKSLNHFSIETDMGISHDLNTKKHQSLVVCPFFVGFTLCLSLHVPFIFIVQLSKSFFTNEKGP